jgi:hypothetical protein
MDNPMIVKYKRKREVGKEEKIERTIKRNHPEYLEWAFQLLAND